ncbi:structure-specific endonuclease subunit slx1 isoform X1 [Rhodamnia argentea]|uniref:Structure-specific endonuclease subunit slx1 isoform X1 n=1 Tax=Rhodamnia argentea TaxID=178133 RepID=A0A8B8PEH4_9MYRT|nr:structure-specific endonuclease subunit slx1 isoform X1 [Rhodamnia argentea]
MNLNLPKIDLQMTRLLSGTFRSIKHPSSVSTKPKGPSRSSSSSSSSPLKLSRSSPSASASAISRTRSEPNTDDSRTWCVYLILSTSPPIKTYVGVTNDFHRRLRQHNGELNGGAKASRAGRPWLCACLVQGFKDRSEACVFESKWKSFSRKLPRRRSCGDMEKQAEGVSQLLLQHRQMALDRVKGVLDCSLLEINWKLNLT